ncbi:MULTISPECIES: hypothetical protein [Haloarcula]|uniref:Uncharacterized protein n=1 Tax=Haloarcula argentinensis TaxID=43776 RepID=A0A847UJS0_HALAR|nr:MULTISPECIES: hypothetical protein [Haloarcula]MUV50963.1 hypothetical protein [Haloarcula sp. CBA1122]NLV11894.1 hypothetical protein [Haloarcula argentinensis]
MNDIQLLLLGVALGAIPSSELGRIAVATLAKRLGLEPREIRRFNAATDDSAGGTSQKE